MCDTRRFRVSALVENQKSGLAGCDGWLGVCTKGSSSHVQAVVAGYCLTPLEEVVPTIPGTYSILSLLRQDQLAEARGAQLIGFAVMHDADVTMSLQQSVAADGSFRLLA